MDNGPPPQSCVTPPGTTCLLKLPHEICLHLVLAKRSRSNQPWVVAHAFNPSTQETEEVGSL
ncbi:hypothetical protein I79_000241 [Cricetulus griseus]|uniref:Uncharacterized protein n=1 Tax=Cricetulus griseus TaxID=10029 RepID=G3GRU7_CRIGR|nr:hypothetical protein I79_000241 [Cricetulus griseus]